jgi:hypothetical protein
VKALPPALEGATFPPTARKLPKSKLVKAVPLIVQAAAELDELSLR